MLSRKRKPNHSVSQLGSISLTMNSGLFTIRDYRDAISQDDLNRAVRKVAEAKKLEGKIEYQKL